ncbi:Hypothetical predicted protein [Mytilus galloprovincialis]|uniref:Peptidase A2 domain-containing protein n=1 Tax=Mytilus galloprovincialis TaxID=29158 RepID=A0A8B6HEM7_MYTGA|nr:Hypothetical predicted protein [Mytilus galloprovincialis]
MLYWIDLKVPRLTNSHTHLPKSSNVTMKPQLYEGDEDLDEYLAQFEILAEINGWNYATKSLYLAGSLKGGARALLNELDKESRKDYNSLVKVLDNRYGSAEKSELFRAKLQTRMRGKEESLPELAQSIKKLTRQAYPSAQSTITSVLALEHFIDALQDADLRLRLRESNPKSIHEAETLAVRLETLKLAERQKGRMVRQADSVQTNAKFNTELNDDKGEDLKSLKNELSDFKRELVPLSRNIKGKPVEVGLRGRSQAGTEWPKSIKINESLANNEGLFVRAKINDKCLAFLVDTGANVTILNEEDIQTSEFVNSVAGGQTIVNKGRQLPDYLHEVFESSQANLDKDQKEKFRDLLIEYSDIFSKSSEDIGLTDLVEHTINTGNHPPVRQRPRRIPLARMKDAEAEIQKMVKQDIIEPSTSPWNSNIVLVKKSDGSWRFCIDFRAVNLLVLRPSYPSTTLKIVRVCTRSKDYGCSQNEKDDPVKEINFENVSESQLSDDVISIIIQWKIDEVKPIWADVSHMSPEVKFYWSRLNSLILVNGILYRKWESYNGKHYDLHIVLPANFKRFVLNQVHNTVTGGHLGVRKTLSKIKQRYFWYKMRQDVKFWCTKCDICASKKAPCKKPKAPMKQYLVGAPWERMAIDILGPLPISVNNNRYLNGSSGLFFKMDGSYTNSRH